MKRSNFYWSLLILVILFSIPPSISHSQIRPRLPKKVKPKVKTVRQGKIIDLKTVKKPSPIQPDKKRDVRLQANASKSSSSEITKNRNKKNNSPNNLKPDFGKKRRDGFTTTEHIRRHAKNDLKPDFHGVFNDDPIKATKKAWKEKGKKSPDRKDRDIPGKEGDVYYVPYRNAGWQGGRLGQGEKLHFIKIVTKPNSNIIITSHPSKYGA